METSTVILLLVLIVLFAVVWICDRKYSLLRDVSTASIKPYSFSRVQLAWWTCIVLAAFITIIFTKHQIPTLDSSTLVLLGIGVGTTAVATMIDVSDQSNPALKLSQNDKGVNFFLDILSDKNGVSISRLQVVIFNIVFGLWFVITVCHNLRMVDPYVYTDLAKCVDCATDHSSVYNLIIPKICDNNLILLGLSSGTYVALKATENKQRLPANNNVDPHQAEVKDNG